MKLLIAGFLLAFSVTTFSQPKKVELFDLVKKFIADSTGFETVGDWSVGKPAAFPVQWQADKLEMSEDLKINFYRKGSANISVNGTTYNESAKPMKWTVMLKGARMGFSSFNISSTNSKDIKPKLTLDSLFGKKQYTFKLLKDCSANLVKGFYYYQLKIPKKVIAFIKVSWNCSGGNCMLSIDGYDDWSKQYADLMCAK